MINYIKTLIGTATLLALGVHFLEDVALISIGSFVPFPWSYVIGIGFSWVMLGLIITGSKLKLKMISSRLYETILYLGDPPLDELRDLGDPAVSRLPAYGGIRL